MSAQHPPTRQRQDGQRQDGRELADRFAFYRPVRDHLDPPPTDEITVVPPPPPPAAGGGWLQSLMPVAGTAASVGFLLVRRPNGVVVAVMAGVMLGSVGLGLLARARQRRAARRCRRRDRERYLAYLAAVHARLAGVAAAQRRAAEALNPDLPTLWSMVARRERLWERRPADADFLTARIGRGAVELACPVRLDRTVGGPLAEHDPDLLAAAERLVGDAGQLHGAPVTLPLAGIGTLAVGGPPALTRALVRAVLCHLAAFSAPADLRLAAFFPPAATADWDWLKWLPHARRPPRTGGGAADRPSETFLADTPGRLAALLDELVAPRLAAAARSGGRAGGGDDGEPHLLLVVDGFDPRSPAARLPLLRQVLEHAHELRVAVLCLVASRAEEPAQLRARIELSPAGTASFAETAPGGRRLAGIVADAGGIAWCEAIARALAPLRLEQQGGRPLEPAVGVRLLDLLGLGAAARIRPEATWAPRPHADLLRVPIGLAADGRPVELDLKEAADGGMGPHGLVIGATGSGKSELLRTIVAGLAVTHPPATLSFVFVDFKGGAAFADLAELPHTAGMITNLQDDLALVDRMRAALSGEQERRQRLLREAGNLDDIRQYRAARAHASLAPMPYLLLVVDEFGELLAGRPDFLDLLVTIGRVGRSLGMHLLLASQRLEEGRIRGLEGHLRYRICLRTFGPGESAAVLGAPDAYHLPPHPGLGYLKVDTRISARFKAALVSAASPPEPAPTGPTDLRVAIARLAHAGHERGGPAHQVWLPPLEPALPLDRVLATSAGGWLRIPVGVVDRPAAQAQEPLMLDFSGAAGHLAIVGGPRTGKSTLVCTILAAFALTHPPDDVHVYCVDFGGGLLHPFADAPHVGGVVGRHDHDRVRRLVGELRAVVADRERLFRRAGLDSMAAYHHARQAGDLPGTAYGEVFLVVDNWGLARQELPDLEAELAELVAAGLHYGVHLILTANRWAELRSSLRDNIGGRFELRLNDPIESEVGRAAAAALPAGLPGRGLTPGGLQFQAALPRVDGQARTAGLAAAVGALVARARPPRRGTGAPELRMLPDLVGEQELPIPGPGAPAGVPIGVAEHRLEPVWLDLLSGATHLLVLGDAGAGKTSLLRLLVRGLAARHRPDEVRLTVVDYRRTLLDVAEGPHLAAYACTPTAAAEAVAELRATLAGRLPSAGLSRERLLARAWWSGPHHVLVVDDYDLVAGSLGNPIGPLADLLGQARDIGLHMVLARPVSGTARAGFEPVLQRLRELGVPALLLSGDPQEGALVGERKAASLPPGRAFLVRRQGPSGLVQLAWAPPAPFAPLERVGVV